MQIEHDSTKQLYRCPSGAVKTETKVRLNLSVRSVGIPESVVCCISGSNIEMHYSYDIGGSRIYECFIETPGETGVLFYCFEVFADGEKMYYGNNSYHLGGLGQMQYEFPESLYQITVYDKNFKTPDWAKNAVIYQIFPDRFFSTNNACLHGIKRSWGEEPFYRADQFGGEYLANDFFCGTLKGIEEKLDYISELGVTAIYLNPIFKAFSNHRYDTSDYEQVDGNLGSNKDFEDLAKSAKKHGIRLILDGVFSHTGADSKYFNKYGNFDSIGAFQSKDSPYYSWYNFIHYPDEYESWWGFDTLPNVNELDESYLSYIAEGENSVIKQWLRRGASGWRLDVADELPDEFIERLRAALKKENPDALLIGEVWEDASNKVSYGAMRSFLWGKSLDSVMNYVFREAVLDFLLGSGAELFSMRLKSLLENYPLESLYSAMNLISGHDVPRAVTVLSGAPDFRTMDRQSQHDYVIGGDALSLAYRRMELAFALQMTLPGAPCIYYGDEAGVTGYADPFNRTPFPWGSEKCTLADKLKLLTGIRNRHQCLRTGDFSVLYYFNSVICYMRSIEGGKDIFGKEAENGGIITIVNSSLECEHLTLCLNRFGVISATDILTGEEYIHNRRFEFDLAPCSFKVLKLERKEPECIKIQHTQSQ